MDDCCFICAEPLEWVSYGPCGHKESCSKCVMRMRFVLKDKRCFMCQQESPAVFVTRSMGAFTNTIPASEFAELSNKNSKEKGYHCLRSVNAHFDDEDHFHHMRRLCSFTHSILAAGSGRQPTFQSLKDLKKHLSTTHQLQFCSVCLEHRKVFISEQQLYTSSQLERHNRQGDTEGPLAESGFTGHPQCRFCKKRFYGDNEIFQHMETAHEHCFICRKAQPDKHVYFKDYAELEGHFRSNHYICEHRGCLANKFVVFKTEGELKQHVALEHKGDMSKGERREALSLQTGFQYDRGTMHGPGGGPGSRPAAIVIGGGAGLQQRSSGGRSHPATSAVNMHEQQMAAAMQASIQTAQAEAAVLQEDDFPEAVGSSSAAAGGPSGTSRWASAAASGYTGRAMTAEDFPALPGTSRSARRRGNQRANGSAATGVRPNTVSNRQPATAAARVVAHSASEPSIATMRGSIPQQPPSQPADEWPQMAPLPGPASSSGTPGWAAAASPGVPQAEPVPVNWTASHAEAPPSDSMEAFPSLPATQPTRRGQRASGQGRPYATRQRHPAPAPAAAPAEPQSNVSESLREANRLLIDKIRQRVDDTAFASFKKESGRFMRHDINAEVYFQKILDLGLLSLTPELASLCPEPERRNKLLEIFKNHSAAASPSQAGGWTPPEVVEAALHHAQEHGSWECRNCGLLNGPQATRCDACRSAKPAATAMAVEDQLEQMEGEFALSANGGKKGKKGKKNKFDRLRVGDEPGSGSTAGGSGSRSHPQNQWSQGSSGAARGPWAGGGGAGLAQSIGAMNDAWSRPR